MKKRNLLATLFFLLALGLTACSGAAPTPESSLPTSLAAALEASPSRQASATATIEWFPPTATETPFPTIEPGPTLELFPGIGNQIFSDQFDRPNTWTNLTIKSDSPNKILVETNHLTLAANTPPVYLFSLRKDLSLVNFYAEINVAINRCQGDDQYGLLVRSEADYYAYRYALTCDGRFRIERQRGGELIPLTEWAASGEIPPGAPGKITLGVWASGVEYRFFVNGRLQLGLVEPTFKTGTIGVFASSTHPAGMNISFSDLTIRSVNYVSPTPTAPASATPPPSRTPAP